jgi:hypothetical protein
MANTPVVFPRDGQGFRAEVKLGDDIHLVFMATYSALGPAATVYNAKLKKWWQAGEWAEDIEEAKQKAEAGARQWYRCVGRKEPFPNLEWTATG